VGWDSRDPGPEVSPAAFLAALFPGDDLPGELVLWGNPSKASRWFSPTVLEDMARKAKTWGETENVYFGLALQDRERAFEAKRREGGNPTPENTRGRNESALAIGALWAEIDTTEGDHKASNLPTMEEAFEFIEALPLPPSSLVLSGGGVHVYWFLRELLTIETEEIRGEVARLVLGWQAFIREGMTTKGWKLDETHELARVLRVPETLNHKYSPPRPVRVDLFEEGRRYNPGDFEPYIPAGITVSVIPQGGDDGRRLDEAEALRLSAHLLERARTRIEEGEARHVTTRWAFLQANDNRIPKSIAATLIEPLERAAMKKGGGRPIDPGEFSRVHAWAYGKPRRSPWATVEKSLEAEGGALDSTETLPAEGYAEEFARELAHRETASAISTGLPSFDRKLGGGFLDGELYVLGGAPKSGKTALALRLALAALRAGRPVIYASFEVPRFEIISRLVGGNLGIPYRDLLVPRQLSTRHREAVNRETERVFAEEAKFLQIIEPADLNVVKGKPGEAIRAALGDRGKRLADRAGNPPMVVFDFLQRIAAGGEDAETRVRVSDASYGLRNLAAADGFSVLALSSINRSSYLDAPVTGKTTPLVPPLGCLKESGDIEYSASGVFILWPSKDEIEARRDAGEDEATIDVENVSYSPNLWIQYARHAPAGTAVLLSFRADLGTFTERGPARAETRDAKKTRAKTFDADALASIVSGNGTFNGGDAEIETDRAFKIAAGEFSVTRKTFNALVAKTPGRFREKRREGVPFLVCSGGEK